MRKSSRGKRFFYNAIFAALLQIVTIVSGFIVPKIILKYYGSEMNGLVTSITQFINYFVLVEAGLASAAIFALYKPLAEKDSRKISEIVSAAKKFYIQSGYIFTILTVVLAIIYPMYIDVAGLSPFYMGILIVALGSSGFLNFFTLSKYSVLLIADQKNYIISIASMLQITIQMGLIFFLSHAGLNIVGTQTFAIVASLIVRSTILYFYVKSNYSNINYKATPDRNALNKRWDALFSQIMAAVHRGAPVILLTLIVKDLTLVSIYSVFHVVVGGLNSILGIFNSGLSSSFGDVIAKKEKATLQRAYNEFEFVFYSIECAVFSIAFVMMISFITIYTRDLPDATIYYMPFAAILMLLDGFLYQLKTPQNMLVYAAGMYKETKWQACAQGLIVIVGGALLCIPFGIYGVISASIISNIYRIIDLWYFSNKHITGLSPRKTVSNALFAIFEMIIVLLPFLFVRVSPSLWMDWVVHAFILSMYVVFVFGIISFVFRKKQSIGVLMRLKSILRRPK